MTDPRDLYMRLLHAMRAPDNSVALQYFDPEFVAYEDNGMPYGGVVKGGEGFLKLRAHVYEHWGPGCMNFQYVTGDGEDHSSAHFIVRGRPWGKGEPVESRAIVEWTWRNDLAIEARVYYFDTPRLTAALEAAKG